MKCDQHIRLIADLIKCLPRRARITHSSHYLSLLGCPPQSIKKSIHQADDQLVPGSTPGGPTKENKDL